METTKDAPVIAVLNKHHDFSKEYAFSGRVSEFRLRLKSETAAEHDRVDAGYGALDISGREDFVTFLFGQYIGHCLIEKCFAPGHRFSALPERISAISDDLQILGHNKSLSKLNLSGLLTPNPAFHPLGLTYVIAGSLHGTNVLRKMWVNAKDDVVLQAHNFMDFSGLNIEWVKTVNQLKTTAFTNDEELQIIRSVKHAFTLFETGLVYAKGIETPDDD